MDRLARALTQLRSEVNAKWPDRSKDSDGWIGDAAHASRSSDHNPWIHDPDGTRVVSAIDITHDPAKGFDSYAFAEWLRTQRDPRIKYVISNRRIFSSESSPWQWRRYSGSNPHDHHVHISVQEDKAHYDDVRAWGVSPITLTVSPPAQQPRGVPQTIRKGSTGDDVKTLQVRLSNHGFKLDTTGNFDDRTDYVVRRWQQINGLHADGVVGPQTWKSLA